MTRTDVLELITKIRSQGCIWTLFVIFVLEYIAERYYAIKIAKFEVIPAYVSKSRMIMSKSEIGNLVKK